MEWATNGRGLEGTVVGDGRSEGRRLSDSTRGHGGDVLALSEDGSRAEDRTEDSLVLDGRRGLLDDTMRDGGGLLLDSLDCWLLDGLDERRLLDETLVNDRLREGLDEGLRGRLD